jgi:beta-glucanase (GH16 family)
MRKFLLLLLLTSFSASAQNWALVWEENFNYTGLPDTSKWSFETGGNGFGNNELQYYTDKRSKNARVENGNLVIEAHKEAYQGNNYTSAKIVTSRKADWKYGKLEVRAKLPAGKGVWPAIWLLPTETKYGTWPSSGEIDVMEYVGYDPGTVHFNVHTEAYNHRLGTNKGTSRKLTSPETQFYTYGMEWFPDSVVFTVDNQKVFTFKKESDDYRKWPFNEHFYLILNLAIGGDWGGAQGIDDNIFPQKFFIDFVKFYKLQPHSSPFKVNTNVEGEGSVSITPSKAEYDDNSQISLQAVPAEGFRFLKWKGDVISTTNPLKLTVRTDIAVTAEFVDSREKILNGGFDKGLENWGVNKGASGNGFSATGQKVCVDINTPGANPWDISVTQSGISLEYKKQYKLKFRASATQNRTIRAGAGMSVSPWSTYYYSQVAITTSEKDYELYFVMNASTDPASRVIFDIGGQAGDVCLDNVSLQEEVVSELNSTEKRNELCSLVSVEGNLVRAVCPDAIIKSVKVISPDGRIIGTYTTDANGNVEVGAGKNGIQILQIELENGQVINRKF